MKLASDRGVKVGFSSNFSGERIPHLTPLAEAKTALDLSQAGHAKGKIIINIH